MKSKALILLTSVLLFSSCVVKSLQPFYNSEDLSYNEKLIGTWTDQKNDIWTVTSVKEEFVKNQKEGGKPSEDDLKAFETYKDGYIINYTKKNSEALFIAMPFKVNEYLFVDFTPFEYGSNELNGLAAAHLLTTHSTAYVEMNEDGSITLKWLSEKAINNLMKENKLRIKHEKTGINEDLVLTAPSEELHNFLKKFMKLDFDSKWDNDDVYTLKPRNARP